jgi:hypothetical protein
MKPDCCICYEPAPIKCFGGCANYVCMDCMIKLIHLNKAHMVAYECPCCRQEIFKNSNEDFSNFCNTENEILKRIVSLLEKKMSEKMGTYLAEVWTIFQESVMNIETNNIE